MGQCDKKWITLNVGGTIFMTSRSTLTKSTPSSSPLHRISSNSTNVNWDRDETGAYLIDRDPAYFQPVLNYLRHGRLVIHHDVPDEGVLVEAEYFNLPELAKLVKQRMVQRHLRLHQLQTTGSAVLAPQPPPQQQQQPVQPVQAQPQAQAPPQPPQQQLLQPTAIRNPIKQTAIVGPTTVDHLLSSSYHHSSPSLNMVAQQGSQSSLNSLFSTQELLTNYVNNILADA